MIQQILVALAGVAVVVYIVVRVVRIARGRGTDCSCGCGGCKSAPTCGKAFLSDKKTGKNK